MNRSELGIERDDCVWTGIYVHDSCTTRELWALEGTG